MIGVAGAKVLGGTESYIEKLRYDLIHNNILSGNTLQVLGSHQ